MTEPNDVYCYDVTNGRCPDCDEKDTCYLWQDTQEILRAIEGGIIGYIEHPDGNITPLRHDTKI